MMCEQQNQLVYDESVYGTQGYRLVKMMNLAIPRPRQIGVAMTEIANESARQQIIELLGKPIAEALDTRWM